MNNPLLAPFNTAFESIPFSIIKNEDYQTAFETALIWAKNDIQAICEQTEKPTFENTIEALELSGETLNKVSAVFFNLLHAETNEQLQKTAQIISPLLSEFSNDIRLNPILFDKIQQVYDEKDNLGLTAEQLRLLEKKYKSFTRNGARLEEEDQVRLRAIDKDLAKLTLDFGENVLAETNAFELHLTDKNDLEGLPSYVIEEAKKEAESRGKNMGWIFTLQAPSYLPFVTYAKNRALRQEMTLAYGKRAFQDNVHNNENIVQKMAELRLERANLLGFNTHADFVLEERMANAPKIVLDFLDDFVQKAREFGERDVNELKAFAKQLDGIEDFERWDHAYYAEKLKQEKYSYAEEDLKPYFSLGKVVQGAFQIAQKLYGLHFNIRNDIDKYHEDVQVYEVLDENKNHLALFYADFFPRKGKKAGAWMTSFREQSRVQGQEKRPHISIVCNFTKPTEKTPSLLTFNEVTTLFHEFGHALHGILADSTYQSLSGTNVYHDFVELPSQFMENFCYEAEALALFAAHYETQEIIPQSLIDKVKNAAQFMEGYQTIRQLSFGLLDMAWHAQNPLLIDTVEEFEQKALASTDLYAPMKGTNMSVAFSHLFNGGYSSGYYSYKWAEVLDADAFAYFKENGIFNPEIAKKFKHLLASGGSVDPMELYEHFRGKKPDNRALLKRAGFI